MASRVTPKSCITGKGVYASKHGVWRCMIGLKPLFLGLALLYEVPKSKSLPLSNVKFLLTFIKCNLSPHPSDLPMNAVHGIS